MDKKNIKFVIIGQQDLYGAYNIWDNTAKKFIPKKNSVQPDFSSLEDLQAMGIWYETSENPIALSEGTVLLRILDNGLLTIVGSNYDTSD